MGVIKKGTAYMNVWMYVIREFEDALDDCQNGCINCNDDPVHAWDEGVAFWHGNEGESLIFKLADKRCKNFNTCGPDGGAVEGKSKVNTDLFKLFNEGQQHLLNGRCNDARTVKEKIVPLMTIPLIQGTLRYAFIRENELNDEKAEAEGAVFAASVLPMVDSCSPEDAKTIYDNMHVDSAVPVYEDVKKAFEKNYGCLKIEESDVGRLWNKATGDYHSGAVAMLAGSTIWTLVVSLFALF